MIHFLVLAPLGHHLGVPQLQLCLHILLKSWLVVAPVPEDESCLRVAVPARRIDRALVVKGQKSADWLPEDHQEAGLVAPPSGHHAVESRRRAGIAELLWRCVKVALVILLEETRVGLSRWGA